MARHPLNILMILRSPVGGLYRHVIDLSDEMSRRGHRVGIIYDASNGDFQTRQRIEAMQNQPTLGVHNVSMPRLFGVNDLFASLKIRALTKKLNADILHGHGAKGGFNARIAKMITPGKIAIYTPHGGVLHYSSSGFTGKVLYGIERFLTKKTNAIIFESAFAKLSFERQIGSFSVPNAIIHNGLSLDEFIALDPKKASFDFAFVGEIRQLKGIHILLEALVDVKRKDGTDASLIIAGGGPDEEKIRRQIKELGLCDRVEMAGVKPAREVFEQARTVIVPSLAESLPYVVLEAAAAQKPVLATNVGGISEIFGPTAKALFPSDNVDALKKAMQNNILNPDNAKKEMQTRLQWVRETFSAEKMVNGIESVYQKAIADQKNH
ncbi:MAG: glycosyltransferase [Devosiaceae bacterium]|nr:glycosyltransferase [Devosiaceae bacterium]